MSQNDSLEWYLHYGVCGFNIILPVKLSTHVSCYEWPFLSNVKRPCKWMHILCMMLHIVCDWDVTWKDGCWPFTICEIYHFCNAWHRKLFNGALKFECLALAKYILILKSNFDLQIIVLASHLCARVLCKTRAIELIAHPEITLILLFSCWFS